MGCWIGHHPAIPLPTHSYSCFLRGVGVLHGVRDEKRESERSLQSSKEWEIVVVRMEASNSCAITLIFGSFSFIVFCQVFFLPLFTFLT
jgi:hypothetical protein